MSARAEDAGLVPAPTASPAEGAAVDGRSFGAHFAWAAGGKVVTELLRLGGTLLLTRLLTADMFGLVLVTNRIVQGLNMASDVGIQASIVQHRRGAEPAFLDTAWTLQIARGILLFAACCALAPAAAGFYTQPVLAALLPVAGVSLLLAGLQAPALTLAQRGLRLRTWVSIDVIAQAAAVGAMVATALSTRSVWALVVGPIVAAAARSLASHALPSPARPRLGWDRAAARVLVVFGAWILLNTFVGWLADSAEALVLPRVVDMAAVGVYGVALQLASIPYRFLVSVGANAVFPLFSKTRNAGASLATAYATVRRLLFVVGGAAIACLLAVGAPLIELALDPRWRAAGAMLLPILVGQWFRVLAIPGANAVFALGHVRWLVVGNTMKLVGYLAFVPIGVTVGAWHDAVVLGALWGFACGESLSVLTYRWALARTGSRLGPSEPGPSTRLLVSIVLVEVVHGLLEGTPPVVRALAGLATVAPWWLGPLRECVTAHFHRHRDLRP